MLTSRENGVRVRFGTNDYDDIAEYFFIQSFFSFAFSLTLLFSINACTMTSFVFFSYGGLFAPLL